MKHRPTGVSFICRYPVHMTKGDIIQAVIFATVVMMVVVAFVFG